MSRNENGYQSGIIDDNGTFKTETEELKLWPYTLHTIDETLDHELIEARGKQLLFQALNNRNLVAFVGSGTSQSYGRLSWGSWLAMQEGLIDDLASKFEKCASASLDLLTAQQAILIDTKTFTDKFPPIQQTVVKSFLQAKISEISFHRLEVQRLAATFRELKKDGAILGGEKHPIVFEVAQQLQKMLLRNERLFLTDSDIESFQEKEERTQSDSGNANAGDSRRMENVSSDGFGFNPDQKSTPIPNPSYQIFVEELVFANEDNLEKLLGEIEAEANEKVNESALKEIRETMVGLRELQSEYTIVKDHYGRSASRPGARYSVSKLAKLLLVDECAHAEMILREGVDYSLEMGREDWAKKKSSIDEVAFAEINNRLRSMPSATQDTNLHRGIKGIREIPDRYWSLGYFKTASFKYLLKQVAEISNTNSITASIPKQWKCVLKLVETHLTQNENRQYGAKRGVERTFVAPTHRFVWKMILNLVHDPYKDLNRLIQSTDDLAVEISQHNWSVESEFRDTPTLEEISNNGESGKPDLQHSHFGYLYYPVQEKDFRSRLSISDEELDPIAILVKKLGVHQFLTTNYDFEIERNFQDRGYTKFTDANEYDDLFGNSNLQQDPDAYRVNGLGGILRDRSFKRNRASDLITFAVDQDGSDASVFHLHGRATPDSKLVVTERDYMNLYLRNDDHRDVVDDGMRVAFSANPILFIGLGMAEQDLLRPLRQFMSDRDPATSRTAIALLPASKDKTERIKTSAALYVRYGVHAVYYGMGWIEVKGLPELDDKGKKIDTRVQIDWLCQVSKLIDCLNEINKVIAKSLVAKLENTNKNQLIEEIESRVYAKRKDEISNEIQFENRNVKDKKRIEDEFELKFPDIGQIHICAEVYLSSIDCIDNDGNQKKYNILNGILKEIDNKLGILKIAGIPYPILDILFGGILDENCCRNQALYKILNGSKPRLAECIFEAKNKPYGLETIRHPSDPYLGFEYSLLAQILHMTLGGNYDHNSTEDNLQQTLLRDVNARITALDNLGNAILTATTCIALDNLEIERQNWWVLWQMSPPHRVPRFQMEEPLCNSDNVESLWLPNRYIRHALDNVITEFEDKSITGFAWNQSAIDRSATGVRSFDNFLDAIETRLAEDSKQYVVGIGRRFYCVAAHRGLGKGSFLSAFFSCPLACQNTLLEARG